MIGFNVMPGQNAGAASVLLPPTSFTEREIFRTTQATKEKL
jgi:hypothetical protein